ncbi:MAG: 2,3-bisphosphoglycerate-independent phosphoglycerate mutase [Kiritimatiellae bacterium]|nr:2,3-bisphosphoglycerate-independent phosphoglycerate mutase [Kiritimatiellia bacterium]
MKKTVLFLGDGMADEPIAELGGKTPIQYAKTPNMDWIAAHGRSGTFLTLPDGFPTSSDVANMSVLGGDLATELCGRGPLEAASQGIALGPDDVAFRMNLVTVDADGVLRDFSAGHVGEKEQREAIAMLNEKLGTDKIRFHAGVSYRNLLVLSGKEFSAAVAYDKPDDNHGNKVADHLPRAKIPEAEFTAQTLREIIAKAADVLKGRVGNGVWPWSGGKAGAVHSVSRKYGVKCAVVSAVDVINGLGRTMGLDPIKVPGATGYVDTNYEGKADAAIKAIEDGDDFVYVHIESTDEAAHEQHLEKKLQAIEDFDRRLIGRVIAHFGDKAAYCVLPDHPVPLRLGKHTRTPVPFAYYAPGNAPDAVRTYGETEALQGSLGALKGGELMDLVLG